MKTKLFLFIFLLSALVGCDNKIAQEEEMPVIPSDTTATTIDTTWSQKAGKVWSYLMSIPTSELVKNYDYPPFILQIVDREKTYNSYEIATGKIKIFAGEFR